MTRQIFSDILSDDNKDALPYAVYACNRPQALRSVPILKPTFVWVVEGRKALGAPFDACCQSGQFVFFAENPDVSMENIPSEHGYSALFIEFDSSDFSGLPNTGETDHRHIIGQVDQVLEACVTQFLEWCRIAPKEMWASRRREVIRLLYQAGYHELVAMSAKPRLSHQLVDIFRQNVAVRHDLTAISQRLAMSESTLRRKLKEEGTSFTELDLHVRLGYGMHLLQTSELPIALISERCGYQSPSRFAEKFKARFGLTPMKLRQTKLTD